jgi:hypothetical protein
LSKDCRIDESVAPEQVAETGVATHQGAQVIRLDEGEDGGDQRGQAVIHRLQVQSLKIENVATDVERQDLAFALGGEAVAAGEALNQEAALGGGVAFTDDILACRDGFQPQRQAQQSGLLLIRECSDALQLADQRDDVVNGFQDSLPW